jgi:ABC-type bacteriocin/lantibiotic exporter with double-glycine peptidase domain
MSTKAPRTARPFRDSALLYAGMAVVFVVLVFITGGNMLVAVPVALACFVVATGYAWWKLKRRLEKEQRRQEEQEAS